MTNQIRSTRRSDAGHTRLALVSVLLCGVAAGQTLDLSGQASGWLGFSLLPVGDTIRNRVPTIPAGLRYIPTLEARWSRFDAEVSANVGGSAQAYDGDSLKLDGYLKPYRSWARFSTDRFEARAGLQKINFGSATLLRPLMWFDRIDPRDPLGLTNGVYGLLGRYYFQNNANLWAWGLIGNSEPKGWEVRGSYRDVPEFGGRAQLPVPRGEVAASYHHRRFQGFPPGPEQVLIPVDDDRVGLDGKCDIGIGLWFEVAVTRYANVEWGCVTWQRAATVGLDYTFGIGNGLSFLAEHTLAGLVAMPFARTDRDDVQVSALMLGYPLGLLDNLRGIVMYDWSNKDIYSHVGWQRTLDNWLFSVSAFWNPESPAALGAPGTSAAGKGVQVMVVYNH